jgi:hypothetical protein
VSNSVRSQKLMLPVSAPEPSSNSKEASTNFAVLVSNSWPHYSLISTASMDDSLERPNSVAVHSSNNLDNDNDQSSGEEDEGPDWTKLL